MRKLLSALICAAICVSALPAIQTHAADDVIDLPILMYHNISPKPQLWNDYAVSPEIFEGDMKYLSERGYTAVSGEQLLSWCAGECTLPGNPVMITFDDGQESFAEYALPILEKYDMCAIMAVVGAFADLYTRVDDHNLDYSCLSWPALAELAASPRVELSSHTYGMHSLDERRGCGIKKGESGVSYAAALNEDLQKLENRFIEYTGTRPVMFAYPYGIACSEARDVLCQHGYRMLFTCTEKVNHLTGDSDELLCLGRFNRTCRADRSAFFKKMGI